MLQSMSVVGPGREMREDPLERRRGGAEDDLGEEEREYERWSRLDRPSRRKFACN